MHSHSACPPQFAIVLIAALAVSAEPKAEAKPGLLAAAAPIAYSAPLVSAPFVAATSSQVFARNYNGLVSAPLVASPYAAAYAHPYAAYPYAAAPYAAYSAAAAPLRYAAAPVLF